VVVIVVAVVVVGSRRSKKNLGFNIEGGVCVRVKVGGGWWDM